MICFNPDGSAQDINSNTNNGVVYLARTGVLVHFARHHGVGINRTPARIPAVSQRRRRSDLEATVSVHDQRIRQQHRRHQQQGFTLLEVLISMFVLTVGLVSMLGVFATAMAATQIGAAGHDCQTTRPTGDGNHLHRARNPEHRLGPDSERGRRRIARAFSDRTSAIKQPGTDGIYGTINDGASAAQIMTLPGPDGIVQTPRAQPCSGDDVIMGLTNYQRSITITNTASADLRQITITIQYTLPASKFPKTVCSLRIHFAVSIKRNRCERRPQFGSRLYPDRDDDLL